MRFFILLVLFLSSRVFSSDQWYRSGGSDLSQKYSNHTQINPENIKDLTKAWDFSLGDKDVDLFDSVQVNPIFTGKYIITSSRKSELIALNPVSGKLIWRHSFSSPVARRGLTHHDNKIFVPTGDGIYVLDAETGRVNKGYGVAGKYGSDVSLLPPVVTSDRVYSANQIGSISSYDLKSGELIFKTNLKTEFVIPRIWSGFSYDPVTKLLFAVTSDTGNQIPGLIKSGGFANSFLVFDAETGKNVWKFQEIKNDIKDLDMVGPPIILDFKGGGNEKLVIALSKTSNAYLFLIKRKNLKNPIINYLGSINFGSIYFDKSSDISDLSPEINNYVMHKIRNAKNKINDHQTLKDDYVMFGLHGGAEWPGGAVDINKKLLYVPVNRVPWVVRLHSINYSSFDVRGSASRNEVYVNKCASCHGDSLEGKIYSEHLGDLYYPSLVGITKKRSLGEISSLEIFLSNHKYAELHYSRFIDEFAYRNSSNIFFRFAKWLDRKIGSENLHNFLLGLYVTFSKKAANDGYPFQSVTQLELDIVTKLFKEIDQKISIENGFQVRSSWQVLIDQYGFPGSRPPWGYVVAIDLMNQKVTWKKNIGESIHPNSTKKLLGNQSFGGLMVTKSGIVFFNGTPDGRAYALSGDSGEILWSTALSAAGSAPPMTFMHNGCQYVIFTATGGIYVGFDKSSDKIEAYKLKTCHPTHLVN